MGMYQARSVTFTVDLSGVETVLLFPQAWLDANGTNGTNRGKQVWIGGGHIHTIEVSSTTDLSAGETLEVWDYRDAAGKPLSVGGKRFKFDALAFTTVTQVGDGVYAEKDDGEAAFSAGTKLAEFGLDAAPLNYRFEAEIDCQAGMILQITNADPSATTGIFTVTVTYGPRGYGTGASRYRDSVQAGISYAGMGADMTVLAATVPDVMTDSSVTMEPPILTFNAGHGLSIERTHYETTTSAISGLVDGTYATTVLNETQIQLTDASSTSATIGGGTATVVFPGNRVGAASNPAFHA